MKQPGNRLRALRESINRYENGQATPTVALLQKFVEMRFDPGSPMNEWLKNTLIRMLEGSVQA